MFLMLCILFCLNVFAASIIVSKEGGAYNTIQSALNAANSGDTIYVKYGIYQETINFPKSGNTSSPIVLKNFDQNIPIIDGNNTTGNIVTISNKINVQIIGFEIRNASNGNPSIGISVSGAGENILIKNCIVHDIISANNNAHGIAVYGTNGTSPIKNIILDGNTVYNCKLGQSESVVLNGNVDSFFVVNNVIHDNDNIGIDFIGFEQTASSNDQARNGICANNRVYNISSKNNPTYGGERCADGIYVDGGRDIIIEGNIVDSCDIGIEVASEHTGKATSNITVRNNFISNSYLGNIMTGGYNSTRGSALNIIIVNNTTYQSNDGEVILQYNNNGIKIINNIFVAKSGRTYISSTGTNNTNISVNNNLYYGASTTSSGSFTDGNAVFKNPLLVAPPSNMHISANSPAIDAGIILQDAEYGNKDIDGENRIVGGKIDIGADEFSQSSAYINKESKINVKGNAHIKRISDSKFIIDFASSTNYIEYYIFSINGKVVEKQIGKYLNITQSPIIINLKGCSHKIYGIKLKTNSNKYDVIIFNYLNK